MIRFSLIEKKLKFDLKSARTYWIYFIGGFSIENSGNFKLEIKELSSLKSVKLTELWLKPREFINRKKAVKFYKFTIDKPGEFEISLENINDLKVDQSMLFFKKLFFPNHTPTDKIEILIE